MAYDRAIVLNPDYPGAHYNKALAQLLAGDYEAGFKAYEWRWRWERFPSTRPQLAAPRWEGEPRRRETVMLWGEQGTGDVIQFVRYAAMANPLCGRVVVACQSSLHRLIASAPGVDGVLERGAREDGGRPIAAWAPLLSLPRLLGTTLETVPSTVPYLAPPTGAVETWRHRLAGPGLKVGLTWAGNPKHRNDRNRSLPLAALTALARVPGVRLCALQKGPQAVEAESPPPGMAIEALGPALGDFAETAAAIAVLDLVIAVDTAVAHLAGALGRPVWCLVPYAPDFRWLLGRADSPWYPSLRLFRQPAPGDWPAVIDAVATALGATAGAS